MGRDTGGKVKLEAGCSLLRKHEINFSDPDMQQNSHSFENGHFYFFLFHRTIPLPARRFRLGFGLFWANFGSVSGRVWVVLGSVWGRVWDQFWVIFGSVLGQFGIRFRVGFGYVSGQFPAVSKAETWARAPQRPRAALPAPQRAAPPPFHCPGSARGAARARRNMAAVSVLSAPAGGFSFANCSR